MLFQPVINKCSTQNSMCVDTMSYRLMNPVEGV